MALAELLNETLTISSYLIFDVRKLPLLRFMLSSFERKCLLLFANLPLSRQSQTLPMTSYYRSSTTYSKLANIIITWSVRLQQIAGHFFAFSIQIKLYSNVKLAKISLLYNYFKMVMYIIFNVTCISYVSTFQDAMAGTVASL